MYIGVDYYPEHWSRERWKTDVKLMKQAGFNVVRMAEFDWVNLEPTEGQFEFSMWDDALDLLGKHGISAILCTPTAVMPAWMAVRHPETLATQKDGTRITWGVRKNNCFTSGSFRFFSRRITEAMARHFSVHPNVIGWQTDNEFGHPFCYCSSCRSNFQAWLRERYGTLDELNRAWGTHFWGHRIQSWEEITIPIENSSHNPGACLDWQRFYSWLNVRFQKEQIEILRSVCPSHFITHNLMGLFPELNYYDLAKDLDFVSWDNYPVGGKPKIRYEASMAADLMRGLKQQNFWIMEQTAGAAGWSCYRRNPRPGEIRNVAYQQLAHGADGQIWFRWRTCTAGREQYWHGLLGHDGVAGRRYEEAAQTAKEYHCLAAELEGTTVKSAVGMIYDYDSLWATRIQPGYDGNVYVESQLRYYRALFRAGIPVDMLRTDADFSRYKVIVASDLYVLPDEVAERLVRFVHAGGLLLCDCRTGVKDRSGLCHERTLPGLLSTALGISIPEYESLPEESETTVVGSGPLRGTYNVKLGADWVLPETAQALGTYGPWHLQPYAPVTRNRHGKGTGYYVGTVFSEDTFYDHLVRAVLKDAGIKPSDPLPEGVEAVTREGNGRKLLFLINHTETEQTVPVPKGKKELLTRKNTGHTLTLERYGVAVIKLQGF